ncbi:MAG: adenylate/guanylate cyclase domain-containing protein [Mariprofundales bacterium]|nr:adenylate/guanylate cyclase domain-containing protein [Mariprofundales bacterium]
MEIKWDASDQTQSAKRLARMPLRWRWGLFISALIMMLTAGLTALTLQTEQQAWSANERDQTQLLIGMIEDAVQLPMASQDQNETRRVLSQLIQRAPMVAQIYLSWRTGFVESYGEGIIPPAVKKLVRKDATMMPVATSGLWFSSAVTYSDQPLGTVSIRLISQNWRQQLQQLRNHLLMAAGAALLLALLSTAWITRRMTRPIAAIASATARVAKGEFRFSLPVSSNDEIGDLASRFNRMLTDLGHHEEVRDLFGRYNRPELVASQFEDSIEGVIAQKCEVSMLNVSMVDFSGFASQAHPDQVTAVLNQYFDLFHFVVNAFDGHVHGDIGDSVMAVFNHPFPLRNHSEQAALAALAMAQICQKLNICRPNGERVAFRMGMHRGEVIIGNIGAGKHQGFTLIGDVVKVAMRLSHLGKPNQLVALDSTFSHGKHNFELRDLGQLKMKESATPQLCVRMVVREPNLRMRIDEVVEQAFDQVRLQPEFS